MTYFLNFNLNKIVKLQGRLLRFPWSRLYYFIRSLDDSGYLQIPFKQLSQILNCSEKTLYRWLRKGLEDGAFRFYRVRKDCLTVFTASKYALCNHLKMSDWGGTVEVPVRQLLRSDFYSLAAIIQAQYLQRKSLWAAKYGLSSLPKEQRPKILQADQFFKDLNSQSGGNGAVNCPTSLVSSNNDPCKIRRHKVKHVVGQFALVAKNFVPIGASQKAIADSLGICDRSVRNHLLGVNRLQFCYPISKSEFQEREFLASETWSSSGCFESSNQFWRYGTNIYDLNVSELKSESFQRLYYQFYLSKKSDFLSRAGENKAISNSDSKTLDNSLSNPFKNFKEFLVYRRSAKQAKRAAGTPLAL